MEVFSLSHRGHREIRNGIFSRSKFVAEVVRLQEIVRRPKSHDFGYVSAAELELLNLHVLALAFPQPPGNPTKRPALPAAECGSHPPRPAQPRPCLLGAGISVRL